MPKSYLQQTDSSRRIRRTHPAGFPQPSAEIRSRISFAAEESDPAVAIPPASAPCLIPAVSRAGLSVRITIRPLRTLEHAKPLPTNLTWAQFSNFGIHTSHQSECLPSLKNSWQYRCTVVAFGDLLDRSRAALLGGTFSLASVEKNLPRDNYRRSSQRSPPCKSLKDCWRLGTGHVTPDVSIPSV